MLRHDLLDIKLTNHVGPEAANLAADDVTLVKTFHVTDVTGEIGHRLGSLLVRHQRSAKVARKQDLGHRIVELEISFSVHEMGRYGQYLAVPQPDRHTGIRNPHNTVRDILAGRKVRDETRPEAGDHDLALGCDEPLVDRRDDIGIRMGGEYVIKILG